MPNSPEAAAWKRNRGRLGCRRQSRNSVPSAVAQVYTRLNAATVHQNSDWIGAHRHRPSSQADGHEPPRCQPHVAPLTYNSLKSSQEVPTCPLQRATFRCLGSAHDVASNDNAERLRVTNATQTKRLSRRRDLDARRRGGSAGERSGRRSTFAGSRTRHVCRSITLKIDDVSPPAKKETPAAIPRRGLRTRVEGRTGRIARPNRSGASP